MSPHPPRTALALAITALCLALPGGSSRAAPPAAKPTHPPVVGKIERLDPALDKLVAPDAKIENLAEGFNWVEGPVWVRQGMVADGGGYLLYSEVKANRVHRWVPGQRGAGEFLKPSGYTGRDARGGEPGSNGLTVDPQGRLVLCQHGDRRVARREKDGTFTTLADRYEGKRFNSPNDLCFDRRGNLYFTDPPYGLEKNMDDPKKELDFQGVFRVGADGKLTLVTKEMSRPNGIALSPDERTLYVCNSDTAKPVVMAFELTPDGAAAGPGRLFFDAAELARKGGKGLPDGLKVDRQGNLFVTGPGGVLVLTPQGKHLGTIAPGETTSNCAFGGPDGDVLYMTCDMMICRVQLATHGDPPPAPAPAAQVRPSGE
jgi:gluconolactonase